MRAFQHVTPALRLFNGPDSLVALAKELDRLKCRRAVVFCGKTLGRPGSPLDHVLSALGERSVGVFDQVAAHSPTPSVEAAAAFLVEQGADAAIAVGGGSAIVTARAASILMAEGRPAAELATTRGADGALHSPRLLAPKLPQLIVPTTPTTAMVKAGSAIFDPATQARLALFDPKTRAQAIAIHPALIGSAPADLMVSASLNTFAMAIEGLVSRSGDPMADAALIHALRLISNGLPELASADDADVRAELVVAAALCGQGSDHTGAGLTTVLGHAIGARCAVENGLVNAVVLPHALRFNGEHALAGMAKVAIGLGLGQPTAQDIIRTITAFFRGLGLPTRLRDLGVPQAILPQVATSALGDWFLGGNPRPVEDTSQLEGLLNAAW